MNTKAILDELARQTKDTTSNQRARALAWANMGYQRVAYDADYPHLRRDITFVTVAGTCKYTPIDYATKILSLRLSANSRYLTMLARERVEQQNPDWDAETSYSEPKVWTMTNWLGVKTQPTGAGVRPYVKGSADVAGDAGVTVTVEGIVGGEVNREVVTLTSGMNTTPVQCANTYTEIHSVSKSARTTAIIKLQNQASDTGATVYCTISPLAYTKRYLQIGLTPIPDAVYTLTARYIPWLPELVNDSDMPQIPERDHEVIIKAAQTYAALHQSNPQMLAEAERSYQRALASLRSRMAEGNSEVPAYKFGTGMFAEAHYTPNFQDYINALYS